MVTKPTLLQLTLGALVSAFEARFIEPDIAVREQIGKYILFSGTTGRISRQEYAYGVYKYKRKKYFIKTWYGTFQDARYYALQQEYVANKILSKRLIGKKQKNGITVTVPKALEYYRTKRSASIVYEYIDGKSLVELPIEVQAEIMASTLKSLIQSTSHMSEKDREQFPKRDVLFYLYSLPFHATRAIISYREQYRVIVRAVYFSLKKLFVERKKTLLLAHRDLTPEHILLTRTHAYILDCTSAALTLPDYDIINLSIHPKYEQLYYLFPRSLKVTKDQFLMTYLSIRNALSIPDQNISEESLSRLQQMYALGNVK